MQTLEVSSVQISVHFYVLKAAAAATRQVCKFALPD